MNENDHHPLWLHCIHVIKSTSMNYIWIHLYRSHYIHGWKWPSSIWSHCIRVIKSASIKLEIKAKKSRMWKNCPLMFEYTCIGLITFTVENDHHPYGYICLGPWIAQVLVIHHGFLIYLHRNAIISGWVQAKQSWVSTLVYIKHSVGRKKIVMW